MSHKLTSEQLRVAIDAIRVALESHYREIVKGGSEHFFKKWYVERGTPYYFLFKKNLKVTNIQFAELLSLVGRFRTDTHEGSSRLQFLTSEELENAVTGAIATFLPNSEYNDAQISLACGQIAETYADLFLDTVIVTPLHGSCVVTLPMFMDIDLRRVCAVSGYIHSCGQCLFIRNVAKARQEDLSGALRRYLDVTHARPRATNGDISRIFFAVYAHEDFTDFDREFGSDLHDGLDDVKVFLNKFHMQQDSLIDVLDKIQSEFSEDIYVPPPGDFRDTHKSGSRIDQGVLVDRTLWLLVDKKCHAGEGSAKRYFVCYEQRYINENPFHIFDEDKPAWKAHTTIPHTLTGAMLNIATAYVTSNPFDDRAVVKAAVLGDPFIGSGTTALEALKLLHIDFWASDVDASASRLLRDNLEFFSLSSEQLQSLGDDLEKVRAHCGRGENLEAELRRELDVAERRVMGLGERYELDEGGVKWLAGKTMRVRLIFYTFLKAAKRHLPERKRSNTAKLRPGAAVELKVLSREMSAFRGIRMRQESSGSSETGPFVFYQGRYSQACSISAAAIRRCYDAVSKSPRAVRQLSVTELPENHFDVIIADPPYGYNEPHEVLELAKLYRHMTQRILRSLNDGGQLFLVLPEISKTGRPFLFFTMPEVYRTMLIAEARTLEMDVIVPANSGARPEVARQPFYWESEKALRRSVMHFRFRKRKGQ